MGVTLGLIITSNYRPGELPEDDMRYKRTEMEAIERRFEIIHINDLLKREKLSLKSKEEIKELKKAKNADFSKVFNHLS
jgi:predicted ATPase